MIPIMTAGRRVAEVTALCTILLLSMYGDQDKDRWGV
jgi:hypothetical protein